MKCKRLYVPIKCSSVLLINNPLGLLGNHGTVRIQPPGTNLNNIQNRHKKGHYAKLKHKKKIHKDAQNVSRIDRITTGPDSTVLIAIRQMSCLCLPSSMQMNSRQRRHECHHVGRKFSYIYQFTQSPACLIMQYFSMCD